MTYKKTIMTHLDEVLFGYKEEDKKTNYELDFEFIQQLAERMESNKRRKNRIGWKTRERERESERKVMELLVLQVKHEHRNQMDWIDWIELN